MKKLKFSRKQILRKIYAACVCLTLLSIQVARAGTTVDSNGNIVIDVPNPISLSGSEFGAAAVSTTGGAGPGISGNTTSGYYGFGHQNGTLTITVENGAQVTGTGSALYAFTNGSAAATVNNSGTLSSAGSAIKVLATGSSGVFVTNQGAGVIASTSSTGAGIDVTTQSSAYSVINNEGMVSAPTVVNNISYGIKAESTSGEIQITNSGTVSGYYGIYANSTGSANIVISNSGTVSGYTGIKGFTTDGFVQISNSHTITATGENGAGILTFTNTGGSFVTNSGTILATGSDGAGIFATTGTGFNSVTVTGGSVTGETGVIAQSGSGAVSITIVGGTISGDDTIAIARTNELSAADQLANETVTIDGAATLTNRAGTGSGTMFGNGGTLKLNLIGLSASDIAALNAEDGLSTTTKTVTVGTGPNAKTYSWNDLALAPIASPIVLQYLVDPSIQGLASALDKNGQNLPSSFNGFLGEAANNPEVALTQFSGKEIFDAADKIGLNDTHFLLAGVMPERFDQLSLGSTGIDFTGLDITDAGSLLAFNTTAQHLEALTSTVPVEATISDSSEPVVSSKDAGLSERWGVWSTGTLVLANQDAIGSSNTQAYHATTGSPTLGADYRISPDLILGLLTNYSNTQANFADGSKLNVSDELFGIYGLWKQDDWKIKGTAGGGLAQYDTHRQTFRPTPPIRGPVSPGDGDATSQPDGSQVFADVTGARDFKLGQGWTISPEVGLEYTHLHQESYTESGAGVFDLAIGDQDSDSLRSHAGFRLAHDWNAGGGVIITQKLNASAYHEFMDGIRGVETDVPGAPVLGSFQTKISAPERDFAYIGAGLDAKFKAGNTPMGAFIEYDVQVGQDNYIAHTINGGVRVSF